MPALFRDVYVADAHCITDDDTDALGIMLMQHPDEQKLDLCGKGLGADGAKALAECLKSNTTITQVRLCLSVHASNKFRGAAASYAIPYVRKVC